MPGKENAKKGAKSSSSEGAAIDETSFSEQSRRDLRELFTMIARLQAENNALRATAHLESITERLKEQVEKLESPQPAKEQGNPLSRRLQRLAEIAIDLPLDIKDDDLSVSDLALLCTVLEDDMRRGALISFAGDSVTFPMLSFCLRSLGEGNTVGFLVHEGGRTPRCSLHGDGNCTWMTREGGLIKIRLEDECDLKFGGSAAASKSGRQRAELACVISFPQTSWLINPLIQSNFFISSPHTSSLTPSTTTFSQYQQKHPEMTKRKFTTGAEESHQDSHHGNRGGRAGRGGRGGRYNGRGSHHGGGHWQGGPFPGQAPVHTATHSTTIHDGSPAPPRYAAEFQHGQFHSHQPVSIGPALLPYQFAPQVPWQPVNQPPNPFSQHQQVSQTQDASPNNVQSNDHRKKRRRRKQERSDHTDAQVVTQVEADQVPSSGPQDTSPSQQELVQGRELRTPHLNYRGSTLSADENPGSSMRRSFIDNNELVNDITWLARPGTRERRCRGTPLDFLEPVILLLQATCYLSSLQLLGCQQFVAVASSLVTTSSSAVSKMKMALRLAVENHPETELCEWPTDPTTETWEKVQETYGGDPKNFYKQRSKARETSRRASDH
ncbi:hypothetical protein FOXB_04521 [Fusarium oxysporum f. sp. conglutinans Fo5176]|uniref:Uncharacterized protein n=1 Tax=Fusarium oxysporum (strain Fo5176) TaxID=660025 RepID=F9FDP3_FUSOF|nr:hypothetical protein FOXB_04521 [Fusarium oxysporum f. sp. conglutinans Fo5176]